jgi:hypothetical protein
MAKVLILNQRKIIMIMTEIEWERYIGKVMHKVGTKNLIGQCSWVVLRSIKAFTIIIVGTYARLFGIRQ